MLRGHLPPPAPLVAFLSDRLDQLPGAASASVRDFRQTAADTFVRSGLPSARAESWKYTPLTQVFPEDLLAPGPTVEGHEFLLPHLAALPPGPRAVFVDGWFAPELSELPSAGTGITVRLLSTLLEREPVALDLLGPPDADRSLSALNAALVEDGCVIDVAAGATPASLFLVSVATGAQGRSILTNTRHLVRVAPGAEVQINEVDLLLSDQPDVLNRVVRAEVGEGGRLAQERVQLGRGRAKVLAHLDVSLAADSRLTHTAAMLGGTLARNEIDAVLHGSGIEAAFNGLSLVSTGQHVDHALTVRHMAPFSVSDQFYKGVLDGKARSAFAGKIVVARAAQKTNAYQANNNLLLSPDAEANSKPELEIYADDVKCSHGATAGEIDERELFYLRSRGLSPEAARALLTFAFLGEVLERFHDPALGQFVRREIVERLGVDLEIEGSSP